MTTEVKANKTKIYYDQGKFKGNTFEQNINVFLEIILTIELIILSINYIWGLD